MLTPHNILDGICYCHCLEGVKPQYSMLQQFGRCYCQVADGMATIGCFCEYWQMLLSGDRWNTATVWQMLLPGGRWNSHRVRLF